MNDEQLDAHFRNILPRVLSTEAEFTFRRNAGVVLIECSWLMQNDPERPHKRSVPIHITITRRLADMFKAAEGDEIAPLDKGVLDVLAYRKRNYSPDPPLPTGIFPNPFEIRIDLGDIDPMPNAGTNHYGNR